MSFLGAVSDVVGWIYFLCWSASFYPQLFLNWKRKTVIGLSFDYLNYNFLGFFAYSVFNCSFYFSSVVQDEYFDRHGGDDIPVELNDVVFAVHALAITSVIILQCFIYEKGPNNTNSLWCMSVCTVIWIISYIFLLLACTSVMSLLNYMYWFSYVKLFITFVKYVPQAFMNWKRKSTIGWSIWQVTLDFSGGIFSLAQVLINAIDTGNWGYITGNWSKIGLSFFSLFFDSIFLVQHYVLYPQRDEASWRTAWNETVDMLFGKDKARFLLVNDDSAPKSESKALYASGELP